MSTTNVRRLIIVTLVAFWTVMLWTSTAHSCEFKFCQKRAETPKTYVITDAHRKRTGDIYDPGHGRRLQIRNNDRQIIGYIKRDGDITDTRRQKIGEVE